MNLSLSTVFGLLGALQGATLAVAIASLGGDSRRPNRALAAIVLVLSAAIFIVVVDHAGLSDAWLVLTLLEYSLSLLYAPLFWHYANTVLGRRSATRLWLHFLPLVAWLLYLVAITVGIVNRESWPWPLMPPILTVVSYLIIYTLWIGLRVWRARNDESMLITHGLVLRVLIALMLVMHLAQVVRYLFHDVAALTNIVPIIGTLVIITLSALALRQSRLFAGYESRNTQSKYRASKLSPEKAKNVAERLVRIMEKDKPFLNESLNAAELAARLSIPKAHLSQILNSVLEQPVRDFINKYRVQEAKSIMEDKMMQHLTMEEIGYAAGFRSRSGFYSGFKRATGHAPTHYRPDVS